MQSNKTEKKEKEKIFKKAFLRKAIKLLEKSNQRDKHLGSPFSKILLTIFKIDKE